MSSEAGESRPSGVRHVVIDKNTPVRLGLVLAILGVGGGGWGGKVVGRHLERVEGHDGRIVALETLTAQQAELLVRLTTLAEARDDAGRRTTPPG